MTFVLIITLNFFMKKFNKNMPQSYENLLQILKIFQNRPNHLSRFLLENNAFQEDFLEKIKDSEKLTEIRNNKKTTLPQFNTISEMKKYYSSLIKDLDLKKNKTKEELTLELNEKLRLAIDSENYEEASKIRDYMKINNIKKLN